LNEGARDELRIVSHFPGRLRVRAETFRVLPEVAEEVSQRLTEEPGVVETKASPITGSLVITYDPRALQLPRLVQVLVRIAGLHGIEVDARYDPGAPDHGVRLRQALGVLNRSLRGKSGGRVDLKVALPGTLGSMGIAMLLGGRWRSPEWYDLVFWSFVTFCNLNVAGAANAARKDDGSSAPVA
jgi:hypothetical protein